MPTPSRPVSPARAPARTSSVEALIAHLKLEIERLRRELHGRRSERTARLIDQLELELEAKATEDELAAEAAPAAKKEGEQRQIAANVGGSQARSKAQ